mmetsp:Transcript_49367/g.54994  ORF Transcript_49367/g.54994 Transcript_49367/m.54994 type:complete len:1041 (+) Transcript_49367:15-3137(+)
MVDKLSTDDTPEQSINFHVEDNIVDTDVVDSDEANDNNAPKKESAEKPHRNRTAILLLDVQNEFVKKGGKLYHEVSETMEATGILQNVPRLVEFARKMNALIIYSPVVMKEKGAFKMNESETFDGHDSFAFQKVKYTEQYGIFTENTWSCEIIHEVEPRNNDVILQDRVDFSAFSGTKLRSILKSNNINHFFVMGFLTNVCVYQTSKDAARLIPDMSTYVIEDCCAAKSLRDHNSALERIQRASVNVVSRSDAEDMMSQYAASTKTRIFDGSDQWLMIDKIFSAAGVDDDKEISIDQLQSLIGSMPSSSLMLSMLSDTLKGTGDESVSKEYMHKILFQRNARSGCIEKIPLFIIMVLLPFLYSISTRLPFIFLALEITVAREGSLGQVGLILGTYQSSRALGNLLIVMFGGNDPFKRLELLQITSGLIGWLFLAFYQRKSEESFFTFEGDNSSGSDEDYLIPIPSLFALALVGLCETIVNLQRSLMIETAKESPSGIIDEIVVANRLSIQYAMVACGSVFAFVLGGIVYTNYGFTAICEFGVIVQIGQLICATAYLALTKNSKRNLQGHELDGNDLIRSVIYQFQATSVIAKYSEDVARGTENALNSEISGLSSAAIEAKNDCILTHSLREMFRSFFTKERDDIASMEQLLNSIEKTETGCNSLASRRPLAMAIGMNKLSKLMIFIMKSRGGSLSEREFVSFWGPRVYLSMFQSSKEANVTVIWPYMKAIILTQAIAALCIGTFLSTVLLSYTIRFEVDAAQVGMYLGIGEGIGMIIILLKSFFISRAKSSDKNKDSSRPGIFKAILERPLHVPFVLFVASTATALFSINNFMVAIVCQMIFSGVNDLSVSLLNELVGTSIPAEKFRYYQGIGQWLRRLGNMVTGVLGPILFGIDPSFPFIFFGVLVFVWALILWVLLFRHAERLQENIASNRDDDVKEDKSCAILRQPFEPFFETARTPWHVQEQLYFAMNKETIEEEMNSWKKAHVDISLLEQRICRIAAALEIEKDQRRALEDRMYARVPSSEDTNKDEEEASGRHK